MTKHEELIEELRDASKWNYDNNEYSMDLCSRAADALESLPTPPAAGEPERGVLMKLLTNSEHAPMSTHNPDSGECTQCPWPLHELGPDEIADTLIAAGYRRQPEPREVTTVEEFALVGLISGRHIPVLREHAEKIAAEGTSRVVQRIVSGWEPFTPSTERGES